ncbi:MAG TPA: hypothetical protein PLP61_09660 [Nocardioides sp.]|uniref:hypothetical protein n=1 Tax=Nocardioides sp. TaxID=35761 RepID=UPI002B95CCBD|nr:hypothetical protein [Nocardioides sp.]HQR27292.1 hypothetical protein [Nocardioides sp.]
MFSEVGRLLVTTALVCTGGAAAGGVSGVAVRAARADVWDPAVTLSEPNWYQYASDSAVSANGDMAVVWDLDGDIQLARRPAGGDWDPTETVASDAGSPQLDYDGAGRLLLVWATNQAGSPKRIVARTLTPGSGWDAPRVIAHRRTGSVSVLDLDLNAGGEALLAWQWNTRGLVSRATTAGTWSTGLRISNVDSRALDVELGDGGLAAVLVQRAIRRGENAADLILQVARQPRGGEWGPFTVVRTLRDVPAPWVGTGGLAVDATGRTTVAWLARTPTGSWEIRAIRARGARPWGKPAVLATSVGDWESPVRVVGNPRGDVVVTYQGWRDRSLRAVHRPSDGPWSAPVNVSGRVAYICDWDAALAPNGRALALWSRSSGPGDWGYGVDAALMTPAGKWRAPQRLTSTKTVDGHARLAAMNHGEALAVWSAKAGPYAFRVTARTLS